MSSKTTKNVLYIYFFKGSQLKLTSDFNIKSVFAFSKNFDPDKLHLKKYDIIVLGAGKANLNPKATDLLKYIPNLKKVFKQTDTKIFGLCYGMQLLCHYHNNKLEMLNQRHKTTKRIKIKGLKNMRVRFNHKYTCKNVDTKKKLQVIKIKDSVKDSVKERKIPIFIKFSKNHYGTQFHFTNKEDRSYALTVAINNKL